MVAPPARYRACMAAAPTPTAMPTHRPAYPTALAAQDAGGSQEILFIDSTTGVVGVVRQRRGDGLFVFHPTTSGGAEQLVEEPGRFHALPHRLDRADHHDADHGHAGHGDQDNGDVNPADAHGETGRRRQRTHPRGHRGGGRGRRRGH